MTPATNTPPVETMAMVQQDIDPVKAGFSPGTTAMYLTYFVPVTAIDFYPAPAASGNPTQRK